MKNLIEEIKEMIVSLKRQYKNCFEEIDCPLFTSDEIRGKIMAYQDCLNLLDQHNIITTPKQIKLSEIVDKLEIIYFGAYNIHRVNKEIYIHEKGTTYYSDYKIEILGNKMTDIQLDYLCDEAKWFYTLWITETEIIDDLEETK